MHLPKYSLASLLFYYSQIHRSYPKANFYTILVLQAAEIFISVAYWVGTLFIPFLLPYLREFKQSSQERLMQIYFSISKNFNPHCKRSISVRILEEIIVLFLCPFQAKILWNCKKVQKFLNKGCPSLGSLRTTWGYRPTTTAKNAWSQVIFIC